LSHENRKHKKVILLHGGGGKIMDILDNGKITPYRHGYQYFEEPSDWKDVSGGKVIWNPWKKMKLNFRATEAKKILGTKVIEIDPPKKDKEWSSVEEYKETERKIYVSKPQQ
jgi:hypothetical protein